MLMNALYSVGRSFGRRFSSVVRAVVSAFEAVVRAVAGVTLVLLLGRVAKAHA